MVGKLAITPDMVSEPEETILIFHHIPESPIKTNKMSVSIFGKLSP
jgi:hypothetical protein